MLNRFLHFINKHALFESSDELLVAVSGGVDSMVLCHLLLEAGFKFSIAHCNFKLRGVESEEDAIFVKAFAEKHGLPFYVKEFETHLTAQEQGISIQMAARELRYHWFDDLKKEHGFDYLVTAHHLNDSAETLLINITRGTSIHGLKGIDFKGNLVRRPLAIFNKIELKELAIEEGVRWREDSSNQEDKYYRNAIRQHVIPELNRLNPSFLRNVEHLIEKNKAVESVWNQYMTTFKSQYVRENESAIRISKEPFQNGSVSAFELLELIAPLGFNYLEAKSICTSADRIGAKFLAKDHILFVERDDFAITPKETGQEEVILIEDKDCLVSFDQWELTLSRTGKPEIMTLGSHEYFDLKKIEFPLTIRRWSHGDRMQPLGMKGKKLVSDILIDKKVDMSEKDHTYVMLSSDRICWLIGYQISDEFKVETSTEKVLQIHYHRTD